MAVKHLQPPLFVFGLIILAATLAIMLKQTFRREVPSIEQTLTTQSSDFKLSSPAFENDSSIPVTYTCKGANVNPPLVIDSAPGGAKEFVLIVHDQNAQNGDAVHWTLWNIPLQTTAIEERVLPEGVNQGKTSFGTSYSGPCPANGTGKHTYIFELYALNDTIKLDPSSSRDSLISAMNGKIVARTQLSGTVEAQPKP